MNRKRLTIISVLVLILAVVVALLCPQPTPLDKEVQDTVGKIGDDTFNLVILTDLHYDPAKDEPDMTDPTMQAIARVGREARIDAFWNLGDFINGHDTDKAEATKQIRTVVEKERRVSPDFHNIMGNHDNNIQATYASNAGLPETEVLSVDELNDVLATDSSAQAEVHNPGRPTDYYVDFPERNIRVVCLSADYTTFLPETAEWLGNAALDTKMPVLVLAHIPTRPEWGFRNDVAGGEEIEARLREFIEKGGTVVAYIHGHDHGDMISVVTDEEGKPLFSEVAVGCARFQYPTSNGTPGMTYRERNEKDETMFLFDVVCVDEHEVRFIRFGAGEDRVIQYRFAR